jgi:flavodoxin
MKMIKKTIVLALTLLMAIFLTACGGNSTKSETTSENAKAQAKNESASMPQTQPKPEAQAQTPAKTKKVLVVYFSRSGNTREMAQQIQKIMGGDIFEIQTVTPYPREYDAVTKQAKQELESGFKPPIKAKVDNINEYDVIFVGSPNWWNTIASPVMTFLTEHDLSGKTIVPFITHAGSGLGQSAADIAKLCPKSTVLEGKAIWGRDIKNSQDEVAKWARELKL